MKPNRIRIAMVAVCLLACATFSSEQPPQAPKTLAIIRNVSTSQVTFEYHSGDTWQKITLESQKDTNISGDRIRIGTDRQDKATITVELPIERGRNIWFSGMIRPECGTSKEQFSQILGCSTRAGLPGRTGSKS